MDVIISMYNKNYTSYMLSHFTNHEEQLSKYLDYAPLDMFLTKKFKDFAKKILKQWKKFHTNLFERCSPQQCLLLSYSDMKTDFNNQMRNVLTFLGFSFTSFIADCLRMNAEGLFKGRCRPKHETLLIKNILENIFEFDYHSFIKRYQKKLIPYDFRNDRPMSCI